MFVASVSRPLVSRVLSVCVSGFFGDLLSLVCQSFSMVDMVLLLLHGNAQPLSRIQPQLTGFFTEHYLQGRPPTDANIAVSEKGSCQGAAALGERSQHPGGSAKRLR